MKPIIIDLSGLQSQYGLAANEIEMLTETCVNSVASVVYANWEALAKQKLHSTAPEYVQGLIKVDKGKFAKQIVLTGKLPNMIEQGASPFDIKEGFKRSPKAKYTVPVYDKKGNVIKKGGDWYLTVPFRVGTPSALGQAGFSSIMPDEIYDIMKDRARGRSLKAPEIPSPYEVPRSRATIRDKAGTVLYGAYRHKNSIWEGLTKKTAVYSKTRQNTYGNFRRAGENSDPDSWIHRGFKPYGLAEEAVRNTDVNTIVENEVIDYLESVL